MQFKFDWNKTIYVQILQYSSLRCLGWIGKISSKTHDLKETIARAVVNLLGLGGCTS